MFSLKAWTAPCASLLLCACASAPTPDYPIDHPANPQAPVGHFDRSSDALARYARGFAADPERDAPGPGAGHSMDGGADHGGPGGHDTIAPEEEDAHAHHR